MCAIRLKSWDYVAVAVDAMYRTAFTFFERDLMRLREEIFDDEKQNNKHNKKILITNKYEKFKPWANFESLFFLKIKKKTKKIDWQMVEIYYTNLRQFYSFFCCCERSKKVKNKL